MDATIQQGGWVVVIVYIVIKDFFIPTFKSYIPAKQKQETEQQRHERVLAEKRLDAELLYQEKIADAVGTIKEYIGATNDRLSHIEADTKETREEVKLIKAAVIKSRKVAK